MRVVGSWRLDLRPRILDAFKYGCVCTEYYPLPCEENDDDEQGLSLGLRSI